MLSIHFTLLSFNTFLLVSSAIASTKIPTVPAMTVKYSESSEVEHGRGFGLLELFDSIADRRKAAKAFRSSDVVPDILDDIPRQLLRVSYKNGSKNVDVLLGNNLTIPDIAAQPEINWNYGRTRTFFSWFFPIYQNQFTLIMLDPDSPCRENPHSRSTLHWLVGNIERDDLSTGDEVVPYSSPEPLPGTGAHRVVLLVFKQPDNQEMVYPEYPDPNSRLNFNLTDFIATHDLSSGPVAGNFFLVENPDEATGADPCGPSNNTR